MINSSILFFVFSLSFFVSQVFCAPKFGDSSFGAAAAAGAREKPDAPNLETLFSKIMQKQESIKNHRMMDFIRRSVPAGVDPNIPLFGEYETFRSDKSANFMNDGRGNIVYRQYRRARLGDILHNVNHRNGGGF